MSRFLFRDFKEMRRSPAIKALSGLTLILMNIAFMSGAVAERSPLQKDLETVAASSNGRLGVCVIASMEREPICVQGTEPFPLQSVMKLFVGAAVLDEVDRGELRLNDKIYVKPGDSSPGPQEFSNLVKKHRTYEATIEELLRRSIIDSDSTSVDLLITRLG
jgi:beta-lactamase class A